MWSFQLELLLEQPLWKQWLPFVILSVLGALLCMAVLYGFGNYVCKASPSCPVKIVTGLVCILPFLWGGFYLWSSVLASIVLILALYVWSKSERGLTIELNWWLSACLIIPTAYLLAGLWGVDAGGGLVGFTKFLPLVLFCLALMQLTCQERERILGLLPLSGAFMVLASAACSLIPKLAPYVTVNHRLAGFFQYPNAFGIFLLCLAVYLPKAAYPPAAKYTVFGILVPGIAMSGSRTTWAVGVVVGLAELAAYVPRPHFRKKILSVLMIAAALFCAVLLTQKDAILSRLLVLPSESSTFLGRLLYAKDALPQVLTHPFGLGYGGYYFAQGSFQTGVYSQRFVHNELLQLLLDIGWLPALIVCIVLVQTVLRSRHENRLMILALLGHALFDFDGQFLALVLLLLLAGHESVVQKGKQLSWKNVKRSILLVSCAVLSTGMCAAACDIAYQSGHSSTALRLYPLHTEAKIDLLTQQDDVVLLDRLADCILKNNKMVSIAYSAKANAAFSQGSGQDFISYKLQAMNLAPYQLEEYEDFSIKLYQLAQLYRQHGMLESAAYCIQTISAIPEMLENVKEKTSDLAWKIVDTPNLEPTEVMKQILERIQS